MVYRRGQSWLMPFVLLSWGHMSFMTYPYFAAGFEGDWLSANTLFHLAAWPFYSLLYLLPALVAAYGAGRLFPARVGVARALAMILSTAALLFIWADRLIFELYSFHINAFVLNLVTTTGGLDSLNTSHSTYLTVFLVICRLLLVQGACLFLATRGRAGRPRVGLFVWRPAVVTTVFLGLFVIQGVSYGIGDIRNDPAVLEHAYDYPFFQKVRFRHLAGKFGFNAADRTRSISLADNSRLDYPRAPVTFESVDKPPNIVWLVAESLRWDQLGPEVMPRTWAFSQRATRFLNHYSSGNGTREGLFGMFYGLYGSYWDSFLHARQSPLLMDRLQALGYEIDLRTGAKFSYPEFDKTILAGIPAAAIHEADDELSPWQRDDNNTTDTIRFIDQAGDGPFMAFQFFESTHAPYFFPPQQAIKTPYLENMNYAEFSRQYLQENRDGILNRYRNAGYWVDHQIGRILDALDSRALLDDTLVIITGDHGEEFMEKGNWGHNSTFVEEQTHVPLVLWLPGRSPNTVSRLTSHLDIATTLLQCLGARGDSREYSQGMNLLSAPARDFINISDWHSIAVVTNDLKIRIPYISTGLDFWQPTDGHDHHLDQQQSRRLLARYQDAITRAIENTTQFTRSATAGN